MSNNKINLFQYEKGRILKDPRYHTLKDAITINNLSKEKAKEIWKTMEDHINNPKYNIHALDSSSCPFCLKDGCVCSNCEYTGRGTICITSSHDFPFIKKLSNKWYKETYKTINDYFK